MGSCASIHRNSNSSGKFRASLVHSETDKNPNSMPCTPVKDNPASVLVVDRPIGSQFSSVTSINNYGSKEEAFFDSQPWLDSDDDFYSVKGDFTPSRGSTPIHSSRAGTPTSRTLSPQLNRALFEGSSSVYEEPKRSLSGTTPQVDSNGIDRQEHGGALTNASSPSEKKRKNKLGDLFHESTRENGQDEFNPETPKSSNNSTPYISGSNSNSQSSSAKRTPAIKSAQYCCFPRLPSARGLKKTLFAAPPTISVDA